MKCFEEIYFDLVKNFVLTNKKEPDKRDRQLLKSKAMNILLCSGIITDTDDKMHSRKRIYNE